VVEAEVPATVRTEGLSWLLTGIGAGVGISSAVAGQVIDAAGARAGFLVSLGAGALFAAVTFSGARWIGPDATVDEEVA